MSSQKPRPRNPREWLRLFLSGLCMGTADLVPGVSGGTMALIMGVYENFIRSLCTFNYEAFQNLIQGKWKTLFKDVAWQYLLALVLGMGIAIFSLAPFFHLLLNDPVYRGYLFALFMGLILASSFHCSQRIQERNMGIYGSFAIGVFVAAAITIIPLMIHLNLAAPHESFLLTLAWMFFCGLLGVCAMLLPGISGSYVLTVFGAYPAIIEALARITTGLHWESILMIFSLGCGIIVGAISFSQLIRWFLNHYHDLTLSCMIGFMLGALPTVWPFWEYQNVSNRLIAELPILPDLASVEFMVAFGCFMIGCLVVWLIERASYALQVEAHPL
ncbi:MAG: hypothetical protein K940chlam3_01181 [Chlamydiae bacterium]|nr:hypothetical protein [Chlamydiota bacterium]